VISLFFITFKSFFLNSDQRITPFLKLSLICLLGHFLTAQYILYRQLFSKSKGNVPAWYNHKTQVSDVPLISGMDCTLLSIQRCEGFFSRYPMVCSDRVSFMTRHHFFPVLKKIVFPVTVLSTKSGIIAIQRSTTKKPPLYICEVIYCP